MTTRTTARRTMAVTSLVAAGLLLSGCSAAGTVSEDDAASSTAVELAGQLNESLEQAGLPPVPEGTAVALYGVDGGVSCVNAGELQQTLSLAQFGNGGAIARRLVMDPDVLAYDEAVISTYCPEELDGFTDLVDGLSTESTIR